MFRLSLRMAMGGGKEAWIRLIAITVGVMAGVTLLLVAVSGLNVLQGSSQKPCWQCTNSLSREVKPEDARLLWQSSVDYYHDQKIDRYNIATLKSDKPLHIPGIEHFPKAGEYYMSPALEKLVATVPADELGNRFPGKHAGTIGKAGLKAPHSLTVVVGQSPEELSKAMFVMNIDNIQTTPDEYGLGSFVTALFIISVSGLLFAIITLIVTSTRLSAVRREERFAAMRLMGATPRQINLYAAIDSLVSAVAGTILGFGLFYALRPVFTSLLSSSVIPFFMEDLHPGLIGGLAILFGAPFLATAASLLSLRRVSISPLGVTRRVTPKPPRAWRALPLFCGLVLMLGVWLHNKDVVRPEERSIVLPPFLLGFSLILVGLVVIGPWLTMVIARFLAWKATSAPVLLASKRLADNPKGAFRPIGVLVIAVFLCTIIVAAAPVLFDDVRHTNGKDGNIFGVQYFTDDLSKEPVTRAQAKLFISQLEAVPGVHVTPVYLPEGVSALDGINSVIISCEEKSLLVVFDEYCYPGDAALKVSPSFGYNMPAGSGGHKAPTIDTVDFDKLNYLDFIIQTDGQARHLEQLRTVIAMHPESFMSGQTRIEEGAEQVKILHNVQLTINGAVMVIMFVAGCSLAVAAAGAVMERKRPLSLLRVAGMSSAQLTRVVFYEFAMPLLGAVAVSTVAGLLVAELLVHAFVLGSSGLPMLGSTYFIVVGGGVLAALGVLAATLPLLIATTKPTQIRFE